MGNKNLKFDSIGCHSDIIVTNSHDAGIKFISEEVSNIGHCWQQDLYNNEAKYLASCRKENGKRE